MFLQVIVTILLGITLIFAPTVYSKPCDNHTDYLKIFLTWNDEAWEFTWHADKIEKRKATYAGAYSTERTNVLKGSSDARSEGLPQDLLLPDKRFDIPFDISHNRKLLISSIYNKSVVLLPSKKFAVVDIKRKQIIRILETDYYVNSLAWAPNGNFFAVLYSQNVTKQTIKRFRLGDLFADFFGHPISYRTFYVSIYDATGALICTECLIEKIPLGRGYIQWNN